MAGQSRSNRSVEKKRELLDAAERVYYRSGDLGLTVRRLAAEAETTSQTIYTYFGSRDAVVDGMYERALTDLDRLLVNAGSADGSSSSAPSFGEVAHTYREYCLRRPAHFQMLLTAKGPEGTDSAHMHDLRDRLVNMVGNALSCACQGTIGDEHVRVMVSAINGFIQAELSGFFGELEADAKYSDMISVAEGTACEFALAAC